jgi:hypothetical protein
MSVSQVQEFRLYSRSNSSDSRDARFNCIPPRKNLHHEAKDHRKSAGITIVTTPMQTIARTRRYSTVNRPRRTTEASGAPSWYDSPDWKARSRAWHRAHPFCVRCGDPEDHRPHHAGAPGRSRGRAVPADMCRTCHSVNTMTGAHIDAPRATVEDA